MDYRQRAVEYINNDQITIMNNPNSLINRIFNKSKEVTVITASYNAEKFIRKSIESTLNQTFGMKNIQYIIIDDCSTDNTPEIIKEYASKNKNICFVSLKENSGSPGLPRNIGIELASTKYITFLDADDWLVEDGIETLYNILEETNDDYIVGKTIKVTDKGTSVIGEYASVLERRNISPFSIPHFFYHMGPTARMMTLSLVKSHNIRFPEMKFAEDKLFFMEVFIHAKSVSTTTAPIYYVNRMEENVNSLTRLTNVLDKRRSDLEVVRHIKSLELPVEQEKVILNRIYEYDILSTFNSFLFVRSDRKSDFLDILNETIKTTKDLRYDFKEQIKLPLLRTAIDLYTAGHEEDFIKLFEWFKKDKNKKHIIKNGLPFYEVPFLNNEYQHFRIPMIAKTLDSYVINNEYVQTFEVYGDYVDNINSIIIRDRNNYDNEISCDFHIKGNFGHFHVKYDDLKKLQNSLFTVFIRYNDYQLINIKRISKNQVSKENRVYEFYTSISNNLSLSIKNKK